MTRLRCLVLFLVQVWVLALLGSCVTTPPGDARLRSVVKFVQGADPQWQLAGNALGVSVRRAGVDTRAQLGMLLEPGDELRTSAGVAAVLQLGGVGEAVLDEQTSVRLGSLEVLFGRIFARLRGVFTVRSETVEAVNDGTRYVFEVSGNRSTRVVVVEGVVTCRSRNGSWSPVRVGPQQALQLDYGGNSAPRLMPADTRDTRDTVSRLETIRNAQPAPVPGFCCQAGQVTPSLSNQCIGSFSISRSGAENDCRPVPPPPPARVWCCVSPNVVRQVAPTACPQGQSYPNQAAASRVCIIK